MDRKYISEERKKMVRTYQIRKNRIVGLVVHRNVISLCVHIEETGNVENVALVCAVYTEKLDTATCVELTVFGEKMSACILRERGWY